jgi:hypothetical protein
MANKTAKDSGDNTEGDSSSTALKASIKTSGQISSLANISHSLNSLSKSILAINIGCNGEAIQDQAQPAAPNNNQRHSAAATDHREDGASLSRAVNLTHLEMPGEWGEHERSTTLQNQSSPVDH